MTVRATIRARIASAVERKRLTVVEVQWFDALVRALEGR